MIVYKLKHVEIRLARHRPGGFQMTTQIAPGVPNVRDDLSAYEVASLIINKPEGASKELERLAKSPRPIMPVIHYLDML